MGFTICFREQEEEKKIPIFFTVSFSVFLILITENKIIEMIIEILNLLQYWH